MAPAKPDLYAPRAGFSTLQRTLVIGLLVTVPLVFDPRRGYDGSRPRYLLLLIGAALVALLTVASAVAGERPWSGSGVSAPVILLVSWTSVSALASEHRDTAIFGFSGLHHGLVTTVSLALLYFATVATVRLGNIRRTLEALWFGAGGGVLLFGLGQLGDRIFSSNEGWDWARPSISPWTIGSTLGNPNDLSSFLAVLLPVGIVLAATGGRRQRRLVVAMAAVAVMELAITASRGGTLAAGAGLLVLGLLFRQDLVLHRTVAIRLAGAVVALTLVVVVVFGAAGVTKVSPGEFLRVGPGSTLDLRLEVWEAAWRMARDHPVLGVGPDVFPVLFPAYASERFMLLFGPFSVANGAHNLFFDTLADLGVVGLAALLWLLTATARRIGRSWRGLRAEERDRRLLLGGIASSLVAYLAQASFNTEDVTLSLCFWTLLGLAVVLSTPPTPAGNDARSSRQLPEPPTAASEW